MLGIFDSGLGGLTVLRHVRRRLPQEDIVYFADQIHVPYGDRDEDDLVRLLAANVAFLEAAGVDAIVMGCNTSCAVAAARGWPPARIPILDLIDAAAGAVAESRAARVAVLATSATARSGAYGARIRERHPGVCVQEAAAPKLVPLVESGILQGAIARGAVEEAVAQFAPPLDMLVLACTHYPLLDPVFEAVLPGVPRLDPALAQARRAVEFARVRRPQATETGRTRYVTTGPLEPYRNAVEAILGPCDASVLFERVSAGGRRETLSASARPSDQPEKFEE